MIRHHPPDEMLATWSAGSADPAEELLVSTHLALCPRCRSVVEDLEALGGAMLPTADGPAPDVEALLARLDEPERPRPPVPPASGPNDLPLPLRAVVGCPLSEVRFRRVAPGLRRYDLPLGDKDRPVALVSVRPGMRIPDHLHDGLERGLVLTGGYTDETGHYARGDVQVRSPDETTPHAQRVDPGERCVIFMVEDGPKRPVDWYGRLMMRLFER